MYRGQARDRKRRASHDTPRENLTSQQIAIDNCMQTLLGRTVTSLTGFCNFRSLNLKYKWIISCFNCLYNRYVLALWGEMRRLVLHGLGYLCLPYYVFSKCSESIWLEKIIKCQKMFFFSILRCISHTAGQAQYLDTPFPPNFRGIYHSATCTLCHDCLKYINKTII